MPSGPRALWPDSGAGDATGEPSNARVPAQTAGAETSVGVVGTPADAAEADAAEADPRATREATDAQPAGATEPTAAAEQLEPEKEPPPNRRRTWRRVAIGLAIVCAVLVLLPVLAAPITADDRYWFVWTTAISDGSFPKLLGWSWERIPWRIEHGRLNLLTELERRSAAQGLTDVSVATSTPIPVYWGLLKVALLGGGIATAVAFVRSLRWRAADGTLVRASRRSLILLTVAGTLVVAVGAQAQLQERSGWTAYPLSTYGAVISIFGSIALLLWLTRLVAAGSRPTTVLAVVVLAVLGFTTNFRYELVFTAIPVAALALLVVPVIGSADRDAGRRAKLITGAAYFGSFIPVFIAIRLYLARVCDQHPCYSGVQTELGPSAIRTTFYNLMSSFPGLGRNELRAELADVGWAHRYSVVPTWWSVLVGLAAIGAMLILWWALRTDHSTMPDALAGDNPARPDTHRRAEAVLLLVGAGLSLLVAIGAAAVAGISSRSQDIITELGVPYRNVVVSWVGLAFCLVLLVIAVGLVASVRSAGLTWGALAAVIGLLAAVLLPPNLMALRANRISHELSEAINWEFVQGDTTPQGEARRCALYAAIGGETLGYAARPFRLYTNAAFEVVHGRPFCSAADTSPPQ